MYSVAKLVLRSLGIAGIVLVAVNTAALSLAMTAQGFGSGWQVHYKHGAFALNGNSIGLQIGEPAAYVLLILAFTVAFVHHQRKGQAELDTSR